MEQSRDWLKTQITRRYLEGVSQEQISIELDVSEGAVSAYLQELRQADDSLILQHEIAVICRKKYISIQQLASNLVFSNALKKLAFDHNEIELLLRTLDKILVKDGSFPYERIATKILQMCNFMEANKISLDEAHKITEEKMQELIEIKKKIVESKKIFHSIERARIDALRKKRITIANIRAFTGYKRAFEDAGIDFRNLKDFANVLSVIGELDSDSEMIIDEMKKTGSLEFRKHCLEKDCDEAEKNLEIYKKEEEYRKKYTGSYGIAMDLVNKTLVVGVTEDEITNLFITIINNKYHYSFTELQADIDTYGGIKSAIFKIKRDLQKLIAEKDNLITSRQLLDFD
ncbi:MAG: hypothetical protein M3P28_07855 [Thermoproteota archaeon]|nr:hypothetical protein [Thermoproteota archaeon]